MKTLLSLFDETGEASRPYWDAGWNVVQVDLKFGTDINDFCCEALMELLDGQTAEHVIMQPPCTDFTNSGALWWDSKDADGRTEASAELVRQSMRTIEFLRPDVWWLENPVGRIERIVPCIGRRKAIIEPWHYAGYTDPTAEELARLLELRQLGEAGRFGEMTEADIDLTRRINAYTKKTALWGMFTLPERREIQPVRVCKQGSWLMRLGGKSDRTKTLRSATPAGFAMAMFLANQDTELDWEAIDEGEAEYPWDFEA